jgi:hypothetical protein
MQQGEQMELELTIPSPLKELCESCITCAPSCCDLDAFDMDATAISQWLTTADEESGVRALQQLDTLIEQLTQYDGPIDSLVKLDFSSDYALEPSADCIGYLQGWRNELIRAMAFGPKEPQG